MRCLVIILLAMIISCSPKPSEKNFGDRKDYHQFGPSGNDLDVQPKYIKNFSILKDHRGLLSSDLVFKTSANIFEAQLVAQRKWENRSHEIAYEVRHELFQLNLLSEIINSSESSKKLQELLDGVMYHNAYSLDSYYRQLKNLLPADVFKRFKLNLNYQQALDLIQFAGYLSSRRFLGKSSSELKKELLSQWHANSASILADPLVEKVKRFLYSIPDDNTLNFEQNLSLYPKALGLIDQFYEEERNYSSASIEDSAYIEAALGLYGGDVFQLWSDSFQKIRKQVKTAFQSIKISISNPTDEELEKPEKVVEKLKEELSQLGHELVELGVDPVAVSQVDKQVGDLFPLVDYAIENMKAMEVGVRLKENINYFDSVIERLEDASLFPDSVIKKVNKEVLFPKGIQSLITIIEQKGSSHQLRLALSQTILIRIWRYMHAQIEVELNRLIDKLPEENCNTKKHREHYKRYLLKKDAYVFAGMCEVDQYLDSHWERFWYRFEKLNSVFNNKKLVYGLYFLSEEDLDWLSRVDEENLDLDDSAWDYLKKPILKGISSSIRTSIEDMQVGEQSSESDPMRVFPFIRKIESSVNSAFLKKVSLRLTDELSRFDQIIESQIIQSIDQVDFPAKDFYFHLKQIARTELKGQIFENRKDLRFSMYEASDVNVAYGLDGWEFRSKSTKANSFQTGAEVLSSAISARVLSFWNYNNLPASQLDLANKKTGVRKRAYDMINKTLALLGVRNYFGRLVPGLIINESSRIPSPLDIYTYAYESEAFGLPDNIWLNPEDNYYDLSLVPENRTFSVGSQAGLLQAGTHFMQLMADWEESPLDDEIHQIKYQEVSFFPKESLIELGLGVSSVVLRNLTKKGLLLFDKNREQIKITPENMNEIASQVTSAALVSLDASGQESIVNTEQMARYMLALYDFIKEVERVSLSRANSLIYRHPSTEESVRIELDNAISLLRKLYIGMANFLSSRMQKENFLFSDTFSVEKAHASVEASLSTQHYASLALLRAHQLWGADLYLWAAIDNYYSVNRNFLDANTAVYIDDKDWAPYSLSLSYRLLTEFSLLDGLKKWMPKESILKMQKIKKQHELALESSL